MDRDTGRWISGWAHTLQSLGDVLTTPLERRVMRRQYGTAEHALVDGPQSRVGLTQPVMAVAVPVARWEPRVALRRVKIASASPSGRLTLSLQLESRPRALFGDPSPAAETMAVVA